MTTPKALLVATALCGAANAVACPVENADVGTVKATVVGIEVQGACTYVLVKDVVTSLPSIDTGSFVAGRFAYIGLDPTNPAYRPMLAVATTALATGNRVYAEVVSRFGRVNRLSVSKEENSLQ